MNIGDTWRGWTVESLIGEGTYGKVYRIVRTEFSHTYESALKVISIPQNSAEIATFRNEGMDDNSITSYYKGMVEDIVSEFVIMSELRGNSNIVSYEGHYLEKREDSFGWDIFIQMEMLTPLYKYMREHKFTIRDAIQLGIDICKALELCQKFNIIHRDIKPENIFVSKFGDFKLGDFGIAKQLENATSSMSKKGTYSYMAPEVYKGESYNSTVDTYSLGIVLYRILNMNRLPFLPPYPQEVRYSDREKANVRRLSGDEMPVPCFGEGRLGEIVLKACSYDPKDRYDSPRDMREALESIAYNEAEAKIIYPNGDAVELSAKKLVPEPTENDNEDETVAWTAGAASMEDSSDELSAIDASSEAASAVEATEAIDVSEAKPVTEYETEDVEVEPKDSENEESVEDIAGVESKEEELSIVGSETEMEPFIAGTAVSVMETGVSADSVSTKSSAEKPKKKSGKIIIFLVILAVLIGGGFGAYTYYNRSVPDVVGMTLADANKAIKDEGLKAKAKKEFSDSVKRGTVISQTDQGETLKRNSTVTLTVSAGAPVAVPDLAGMSKKEATKAAEKLELKITVAKKELSETIKKNYVISQEPAPSSEIEIGSEIKLVISKGIIQVEVPDVIGMTSEKAEKSLKKAGLKTEVTTAYSSEEVGTIIAQSVDAGNKVDINSKITLTSSAGPEPQVYYGGGSSRRSSGSSRRSGGSSSKKKSAQWS